MTNRVKYYHPKPIPLLSYSRIFKLTMLVTFDVAMNAVKYSCLWFHVLDRIIIFKYTCLSFQQKKIITFYTKFVCKGDRAFIIIFLLPKPPITHQQLVLLLLILCCMKNFREDTFVVTNTTLNTIQYRYQSSCVYIILF